jgi:hypothetical protein
MGCEFVKQPKVSTFILAKEIRPAYILTMLKLVQASRALNAQRRMSLQ